jgi:DNA invertase Pin-like site-specific DNA recombinase
MPHIFTHMSPDLARSGCRSAGVHFVCRTSGLSVGGGASTFSGKLILAVILSLAEFERDLLRERVRSGSLTDIHTGRLPASFSSTRTPLWRSFDERATNEAESS